MVLKFFSFLSILFGWFVGKHGEEFVSWKVFETLKVGIQKTFCGRAEGLLNLSSVSELLLHSVVLLGQWRSQEWLVIALCLLCLLYLLFFYQRSRALIAAHLKMASGACQDLHDRRQSCGRCAWCQQCRGSLAFHSGMHRRGMLSGRF